MPRLLLALAALIAFLAPAAASADTRTYVVTNFDRVRVDGPFEVRVQVGGGVSQARAEGEGKVLDNLDLSVQGSTLIVRKGNRGWGEQGKADGPAPVIVISAPSLRGATVIGGGRLIVAGKLDGQRFDVQVTGNGSVEASGIDAEDVNVTLIGSGGAKLSGRTLRARLLTNGNGEIAAGDLVAGDLFVRLDGPGKTSANARFTADVTSTGIGAIAVAGNPKCKTNAIAGGPITCGAQ